MGSKARIAKDIVPIMIKLMEDNHIPRLLMPSVADVLSYRTSRVNTRESPMTSRNISSRCGREN